MPGCHSSLAAWVVRGGSSVGASLSAAASRLRALKAPRPRPRGPTGLAGGGGYAEITEAGHPRQLVRAEPQDGAARRPATGADEADEASEHGPGAGAEPGSAPAAQACAAAPGAGHEDPDAEARLLEEAEMLDAFELLDTPGLEASQPFEPLVQPRRQARHHRRRGDEERGPGGCGTPPQLAKEALELPPPRWPLVPRPWKTQELLLPPPGCQGRPTAGPLAHCPAQRLTKGVRVHHGHSRLPSWTAAALAGLTASAFAAVGFVAGSPSAATWARTRALEAMGAAGAPRRPGGDREQQPILRGLARPLTADDVAAGTRGGAPPEPHVVASTTTAWEGAVGPTVDAAPDGVVTLQALPPDAGATEAVVEFDRRADGAGQALL